MSSGVTGVTSRAEIGPVSKKSLTKLVDKLSTF